MVLNRCKIYNKTIDELYDALINYDGYKMYNAESKLYDLEYEHEHTNCQLFKHYAIEMSYERWYVVFESAKNIAHTTFACGSIYEIESIIDNLITKYPRHMKRLGEANDRLTDLCSD